MNIKIFKDKTGPYPNSLHDYSSYMQGIIHEIEKIGIENIFKLNIFYDKEVLSATDNIEIKPHSIIVRGKKQCSTITKIINIKEVFEIQILFDENGLM